MTKYDKANELLNKLDFEDGKYEITDALVDMYDWTKNELLKNATDIRINRDFLADIKQYIHEKYLDYKVGDKIKLVLIKEEL